MVYTADTMAVLARDRIIEVSFDQYVNTANGLFNFLEVCGGMTLWMMIERTEMRVENFLRATAYTFSFNGVFMIMSSILSATSAYYLPLTFYYVLFQGTGSVLYIFTSIIIIRDAHEVKMTAMVGLLTGAFHAFHCAYATHKIYYENS
ncbi:uncharacterized protein LOC144134217 [Amblyomma americanum]